MTWVTIATWGFTGPAIKAASEVLDQGGRAEDAAQIAVELVESDPAVDSVGYGGCPNVYGEMELDAAFMDGTSMNIGAVAALKGFKHPVAVARMVMEKSKDSLLVGSGAEAFALRHGFKPEILLSTESIDLWRRYLLEFQQGKKLDEALCHDTVGVVCQDRQGQMIAATSTSGLAMKQRGRVGDSPLVGSGFFADAAIGAAAATGVGEDIMKGCTSYYTVLLMEQGASPQEAAKNAVIRTHRRIQNHQEKVGNIAVVCADSLGRFGAAANHDVFSFYAASDIYPLQHYDVKSVFNED